MNILDFTLMQMEFFLLIIVRTSGFFLFTPFFGSRDIPNSAKGMLAFLFAFIIFPTVWDPAAVMPTDITDLAMAAFAELSIGILMGFTTNLVFIGVQFAGFLIGHSMGLAMANVLDPFTESQVSIIAQIYFYLLLAVFIIIGGPDWFITAISRSFQLVEPGGFVFSEMMAGYITAKVSYMFTIGIMFAAPLVGSLFIVIVILGFLARTMPQMNIFVIGMPAQIITGIILLMVGLTGISMGFDRLLDSVNGITLELLDIMGEAAAHG